MSDKTLGVCRVGKSENSEKDDTHGRRKYSLVYFYIDFWLSKSPKCAHGAWIGKHKQASFFYSVDANMMAIHTSWQV